jgi:hypothetical protein
MDERAQSVVRKSSGRCTTSACGRTVVWRVVVGRTRLRRDGVGSGAACHKLVHDSFTFYGHSTPHAATSHATSAPPSAVHSCMSISSYCISVLCGRGPTTAPSCPWITVPNCAQCCGCLSRSCQCMLPSTWCQTLPCLLHPSVITLSSPLYSCPHPCTLALALPPGCPSPLLH